MGWTRYRRILSNPTLRAVLFLGLLVRIPTFATGLVLTLHVTSKLGLNFASAGLISAASTLSMAISNPWRGRLLDRTSLRRVLVPSIVIGAACWAVAPFVGYGLLAALVCISGLFTLPSFSIIRQAVIAGVDNDDRRAALSLDSVGVESAYMLGPVLGVWAASSWPTEWVLFGSQLAAVSGGVLLWVVNPPLRKTRAEALATPAERSPSRLFSRGFLLLCVTAAATSVVLIATELGTVAAMRALDAESQIGIVLAFWGAGSLFGGLYYGSLRRSVSPNWMLVLLSVVTVPIAAANDVLTVGALVLVAGLLCAPTIVSTIDAIGRIVPESVRGEAMGWHGSSMTVGAAIGAPLAGALADHFGWRAVFATMGMAGLAVAVLAGVPFRNRVSGQ